MNPVMKQIHKFTFCLLFVMYLQISYLIIINSLDIPDATFNFMAASRYGECMYCVCRTLLVTYPRNWSLVGLNSSIRIFAVVETALTLMHSCVVFAFYTYQWKYIKDWESPADHTRCIIMARKK